ncbi:GNAT superfamily N-acetyltransferase [Microbacterium halimionae]|uniref:GNAT superfamily N-acetyltransferase n=1 Tax=Microbacterium halimionae TaxID=1526413 RepID=A0A7W3JMA4_9MICO|nr:GNAT family N-acetyltransferase [Microbacterium halimionae]MBA8815484.1 GNAT superfamily N-acetyltransferase [Microbacterium halimionae]NII95531.1 GNAT superfamily N-acetyltransferase [Microbacterium halimionae]
MDDFLAAPPSELQAMVSLRAAVGRDIEWLVEIRADVLRTDLERLGRYDSVRVRQRMRDAFKPASARVIVVDGSDVGSITVRVEDDARWIEHFYISAALQGRGVGSHVLETVLAEEDSSRPFRLNVLQGSAARRLYERYGFVVDSEDAVDVFMSLPPA